MRPVTIDFDISGYEPLRTPFPGVHVSELERADARIVFKQTIAAIPERRDALRQLLERNRYRNDFEGWDDFIAERIAWDPEDGDELHPVWRSIVLDMALTMSDMLIERSNGQIRWKFYTGSRRSLDFHCPVLVGFQSIPRLRGYMFSFIQPLRNVVVGKALGDREQPLRSYFEYIAEKI